VWTVDGLSELLTKLLHPILVNACKNNTCHILANVVLQRLSTSDALLHMV
jgi:hypothetical protein